jgi:hypothetical protein
VCQRGKTLGPLCFLGADQCLAQPRLQHGLARRAAVAAPALGGKAVAAVQQEPLQPRDVRQVVGQHDRFVMARKLQARLVFDGPQRVWLGQPHRPARIETETMRSTSESADRA